MDERRRKTFLFKTQDLSRRRSSAAAAAAAAEAAAATAIAETPTKYRAEQQRRRLLSSLHCPCMCSSVCVYVCANPSLSVNVFVWLRLSFNAILAASCAASVPFQHKNLATGLTPPLTSLRFVLSKPPGTLVPSTVGLVSFHAVHAVLGFPFVDFSFLACVRGDFRVAASAESLVVYRLAPSAFWCGSTLVAVNRTRL